MEDSDQHLDVCVAKGDEESSLVLFTSALGSTLFIVLIRMVTQKAFSANSQIRGSDQHDEWQSFSLERPWVI